MAKHEHAWYPIAYSEERWSPEFGKGVTKPRGWQPVEAGEPMLWACSHTWVDTVKVGTRIEHQRHRCITTLTATEAHRERARGKFNEIPYPEGTV